jgi:hypothetical protein
MADEATLKDVTTEPNSQVTEPVKSASEPAAAAPVTTVTDTEASEIGRLLMASGYTKDNVNQMLEAPTALASLRHLIKENPQEFYALLDRTDPDAAKRMLDVAADSYVKRYGDDAAPKGAKKDDATAQLMQRVEKLQEQVTGFQTAEQQRMNAAAMASIKSRYEGRVDELFNQLPKDASLTKSESRALRARLAEELTTDQQAQQRIMNGNFYDVPLKFKSIMDEWGADRKAAADGAKAGRDKTANASFAEFQNGAQPWMLDIPTNAADSWDNTEEAFAKGLERAATGR